MNLLTKFTVLLMLLAGTAVFSVGVPACSVIRTDREVTSTQLSITAIIDALDRIHGSLASEPVASPDLPSPLMTADARRGVPTSPDFDVALRELEQSPELRRLMGTSTGPGFLALARKARERMGAGDIIESDDIQAAQRELDTLMDLLVVVQSQILEEARFLLNHRAQVDSDIERIVMVSVVMAILTGGLTLLLMRRWVILPVLELQKAATAFSSGNFAYRLEVQSRDELGQLAAEMNGMVTHIAEMQTELVRRERLAAIDNILKRLAHNLRSPLTGIRNLAEVAQRELPEQSDLRDDQQIIVSTVDQLNTWITNLVNSNASIHCRPEPGDPVQLVQGVVTAHQGLAATEGISLRLEVDPSMSDANRRACHFDTIHMEHAIAAVMANAIEATPLGGEVRISLRVDPDAAEWQIVIEDSGEGIDSDALDHIFEAYFTTKRRGTGIGLAAARRAVQSHQGRIDATSSELGGAAFRMTLPLLPPTETA